MGGAFEALRLMAMHTRFQLTSERRDFWLLLPSLTLPFTAAFCARSASRGGPRECRLRRVSIELHQLKGTPVFTNVPSHRFGDCASNWFFSLTHSKSAVSVRSVGMTQPAPGMAVMRDARLSVYESQHTEESGAVHHRRPSGVTSACAARQAPASIYDDEGNPHRQLGNTPAASPGARG